MDFEGIWTSKDLDICAQIEPVSWGLPGSANRKTLATEGRLRYLGLALGYVARRKQHLSSIPNAGKYHLEEKDRKQKEQKTTKKMKRWRERETMIHRTGWKNGEGSDCNACCCMGSEGWMRLSFDDSLEENLHPGQEFLLFFLNTSISVVLKLFSRLHWLLNSHRPLTPM